jgi:hypothetical protein
VKRSLSTGCSRGEARDYSRPSLLALPRGMVSATAAHSAYSPDADGAATPAQMVEVRRLFNETGLDVRVSATYSAKSAAWDVVEAALVGISNLRF